MKIAIGSDHGGLELKKHVVALLKKQGHEVFDFGTHSMESCDYPDFAFQAAQHVAKGQSERGIVICTTGIGVSIVANKVRGVRCALVDNEDAAKLTRMHNNTNVLALGARYVEPSLAEKIVTTWLETEFEGGRHQRRVDKIAEIEGFMCE